MPQGLPGMSRQKQRPLVSYTITDCELEVYAIR
jgi:hypothetical protein